MGAQGVGVGRIGQVHHPELIHANGVAIGAVHKEIRDHAGALPRAWNVGAGRIAHIQDAQAPSRVGHVGIATGNRHLGSTPPRVGSGDQGGIGWGAHVQNVQTLARVRYVRDVAHYLNVLGRARRVVGAAQGWIGRVAHVHDMQAARVVGHIRHGVHHLNVPGKIRRIVGADKGRTAWLGHVEDQQAALVSSQVGILANHLDGPDRKIRVIEANLSGAGRVAHVHNTHAPSPAVRNVGQGAGNVDSIGLSWRIVAAQQGGVDGIREVHHPQAEAVDQVGGGVEAAS